MGKGHLNYLLDKFLKREVEKSKEHLRKTLGEKNAREFDKGLKEGVDGYGRRRKSGFTHYDGPNGSLTVYCDGTVIGPDLRIKLI
jgi:hypothetical protein